MKILACLVLCLGSLTISAVVMYPQTPPGGSGIHIANLMTAAEFQKSGLSKQTPAELAALDAWLNSYLGRVIVRRSSPASSASGSLIETQIDGEFHGWDGETVFKLANGQIWQQSEYDYDYEYAYRPDVMIYKTDTGYKMKVEDVSDPVSVKRLK